MSREALPIKAQTIMLPFAMTYEEIVEHLHPLSPRPSQSRLTRITYDFDPEGQRIVLVETHLQVDGEVRVLRFHDIWSNTSWGELRLAYPFGSGILVVDALYRGWEHTIMVVGDDEECRTLFGSAAVEEAAASGGSNERGL
jgi:hypothetical protein